MATDFKKVTDVSELEAGKKVIITNADASYGLGGQATSNRTAVGLTKNDDLITVDGTTNATVTVLTLGKSGELFTFYDANNSGYLYAASSEKNQLKTQSALNDNGKCTIAIANGVATIKFQGTNKRNWIRYNPNNGSPIFSCYRSGQNDVAIYQEYVPAAVAAPTVSLAAGTYYEAQKLTITAPEGATLDGLLNETVFENVSEYTTTLEVVNDDITTYKLDVWSTKDGVSSDAVSATFVINPNVIDATVTGVIDMADIDDSNFIKNGANMVSGQEYSINDSYGTKFSFSAVKGGGNSMPFRTAKTTAKQCLRLYLADNSGNVLTIGSEVAISKIAITTGSALKIDGEKIAVNNSVVEKEYAEGCKSFTIEPTTNKQDIYSIAITYSGKVHFDKVKNGAALIGMKKGKLYKVNVALQGIEANGGVLYARTYETSAAPSEPGKTYFDKSYEDYDLTKFDQRDWVAIEGEGLTSADYAGKEIVTGFVAAYDGEKLTPVTTIATKAGEAASYTLNTFAVANVFYGKYENTETLGMKNDYRPFFVKAKVNEVANYAGTLSKDSASEGSAYRLTGSGKCGVFEGKGVLLEPASEEIRAALDAKLGQYQIIEGVLLTETSNTLANGDVKIVALAGPADAPTGVAALKADGKATVYGTEGAVVVNGADGKVMIFDAMGRMVKNVSAEGAATVAMPAGYYIVRTAGTAAKVMVK